MAASPIARPARFFHGWVIVCAAASVLFVAFGTAYSFAAFFNSLRDEFDASRGDVSLVFAITGFLYFAFGAISGPISDRIGPRRVVLAGITLVAAGLFLASAAHALWQVYLTYSLGVGVGVGLAYVPSVSAVQRWFVRRRGLASGIAVSGIGTGTLVVPLLVAGIIALADWREAYVALGLLTLVLGVPAALVLENAPERRGLLPDGATRPANAVGAAIAAYGSSVREAVRSAPFWLLFSSGVCTSLGLFIPFAHLAAYAKDEGFSSGTGALLVGLIGVGSTAGRLLLGGSADRFGRRLSLTATFAVMGLSLLAWLAATEIWSLSLFALVFGAAYGGFVALLPALAADYFGGRRVGSILGFLYASAAIGSLVGPTIAGVIYDARESYTLPILLGAAMNAVAMACLMFTPDPIRWRTEASERRGDLPDVPPVAAPGTHAPEAAPRQSH